MAEQINRKVLDLSHYNTILDWNKIRDAGIVGIIHKSTEGGTYVDKEYAERRQQAIAAGLLWGAYHFGNATEVEEQVQNFLKNVDWENWPTLLALDYEPNQKSQMSLDQARVFMQRVYEITKQMPVLYSGNLIKEQLGSREDQFFGSHRLWLAQYGSMPSVPAAWDTYWLWQYSDGAAGPEPKNCPGVNSPVDTNSFLGSDQDLANQWLGMEAQPEPIPEPEEPFPDEEHDMIEIQIKIKVPKGTLVDVSVE